MPHAVDAVLIHPRDNVAFALRALTAGTEIQLGETAIPVREEVPAGHKIAVKEIPAAGPAVKYGQPIGLARETIPPGSWVHTHNLRAADSDVASDKAIERPAPPPPPAERTFEGYRRAEGRYGTRNYLAVISTVNCSASVARFVAERFPQAALRNFPNLDGVVAFKHSTGCGMAHQGLNHQMLNRVLGGLAKHPNVGGCLLIGLGCEQGAMGLLLQEQQLVPLTGVATAGQPSNVLSMQDLGGTTATIEGAVRRVDEMLPRLNDVRRETCPAGGLKLALECGGSDGYSGVTANPALGVAADLLVAAGGTAILAETPEIYGAESLLMRRAASVAVADKLAERIAWWKWYAGVFGQELDNNPSPGNKAGGLTTIAEKSLGAVAKAGSTMLMDVYQYAEPVNSTGMVVMDTPGYDPVSVTGMVAGGANLVAFTTGRGSCFGCKPAPTLKIATNTPMFERMRADMDFDAGRIASGASVADVGAEIYRRLLAVASGERTRSEQLGVGDDEFLPWVIGPVL